MVKGTAFRKKALGDFCTQLSELMAAGIPVVDSLDILKNEGQRAKHRAVLLTLKQRLWQGAHFSEALAEAEPGFPPLMIAMCRAGEKSGSLVWMLSSLGDYYTGMAAFEAQLLKTLFYPMVVLLVALGVMTFMSIWVLPVFSDIYLSLGVTPPLLTQVVLTAGRWLGPALAALGGLGAMLVPVWHRAQKNQAFGLWWGRLVLRLPILGRVRADGELASFFQALGMMSAGGVGLLTALETALQVLKNPWISARAAQALKQVRRGAKVSQAFGDRGLFGERALQLLVIGEATGDMDGVFLKAAEGFRRAGERRMAVVSALLEPVTILGVGGLVFVVVLAVMLPVFGIYENYTQLF
ncbi:MAG: type II secretion system F family protein [Eubacterium sp.]|nr:type II secretion system F family protein [Eubacterium sp.]